MKQSMLLALLVVAATAFAIVGPSDSIPTIEEKVASQAVSLDKDECRPRDRGRQRPCD